MSLPHEVEATFDTNGALIFRYRCLCGLQSAWADSPEAAEEGRPANCKAHDEHGQGINDCPACSVRYPGRTVGGGAELIAQHMTRHMETA